MKKTGQLRKRLLCMLLAVLLGTGLAFTGYAPAAEAAGETRQMANLVIFVKMKGDTANTLDDNWSKIKSMYDGGTVPGVDNSFSNYISTVTCGKVTVTNIFPQQYADGSGERIQVLELSKERYDTSDEMVTEVIDTIAGGGVSLDSGRSLDLDGDGCVDNLTIIVQGDNINGIEHSFKTDYGGDKRINGSLVRCYNAMPYKMLEQGYMRLISHEFLHTLGLPDLYRASGDGADPGAGPVGIWDVMASATSTAPQYVLGYLRAREGWLEGDQVSEITKSGTYTLTAVSQPDDQGGVRLFTIRTPLSYAESETICLEYRRAMDGIQFDHFVDEGLVMYRVDDKVPDHTNFNGENYIYVYRPECSVPNDCSNTTVGAALNVEKGETSYGSTDLSASFSENTLYYSDGSNSGIRISNLQRSSDETSITFQVDFAEYGDEWQALGGTAANDVKDMGLYADSAGQLYFYYINTSDQVCVRRWDQAAGSWQQLGGACPAAVNSPIALADCNGQLYLAYVGTNNSLVYSVWNGSSWSGAVPIENVYPNSLQLVVDGGEIYAAYQEDQGNQKQLVIRNLNGTIVTNDRYTALDFCNPTVVKKGELFYVAYAEFPGGNGKIDTYDTVTKAWTTIYDYGTVSNTVNKLHCQGTKLYGLSGTNGASPFLTVWDGAAWTKIEVPQITNYFRISLVTAGETVYLACLDTSTRQAGLLRLSGNSFVPCYDGLNGQADEFQAVAVGDQVYVATMTGNLVTVRCQKVEYEPDVTPPPLPPLTLSLTPPAGYDNADVYIDGVKYTATKSGNSYVLQLPDKTGRTAVMYYYNERNVPKGMYVWRLGYQGDTCTATPLPGLQDLLSYHGFSIRVQGYSGLRFKSGIDTQKRAQLLGDGISGYHLTEYGTLLITGSNLQRYPFVKDGEKVGGGRSYWTENGVVNDRIFETVEGRYRFASVVTKLPEKQYATELAFRSYAILQSADGGQLIIYGPPVARSIYTVAKQVLAAGEFKQGSSGYNYVKGIVDIVEGR